jgi:hypothetical protein
MILLSNSIIVTQLLLFNPIVGRIYNKGDKRYCGRVAAAAFRLAHYVTE